MTIMAISNYLACPECDLLLRQVIFKKGETAHCPRCHYLLRRPKNDSILHTFVLSLTGLFLALPANILPIMSIKVLGNTQDGTLWGGVVTLFNEGMWGIAIVVFLASMLFPILSILLSLLISAHLYFNRFNRYLILSLRLLHHIEEWAMLEVYLMGIIVACVKLSSMSELKFGLGLSAFVLLLIVSITLSSNFDSALFWQKMDQLRSKKRISQQAHD